MVKPKKIVCICEDLTVKDLQDAFRNGFDDFELLKRYTGVCTGPCQGKFCLTNVIEILSEMKNVKPEMIGVPALRPPFKPTRLLLLTGEAAEE